MVGKDFNGVDHAFAKWGFDAYYFLVCNDSSLPIVLWMHGK